jgi:hypothetical protein
MRARLFLVFLPLLASFLGVGLGAGVAVAQPAQPLDRLLPQIRRDHPGQFLDAEGANTGGNPHYHLKWLTPDGRVMWLDTDARTGRVLSQSPGRDRFDGTRYGAPDRDEAGRSDAQRYGRQDGAPYYYRGQSGAAPPGGQRYDNRPAPYSGNDRQFGNGRPAGNGGFGNRDFGNRGGNRGFGGGGRSRGGH